MSEQPPISINGPATVDQPVDLEDVCIAGPDGVGTTRWSLQPCRVDVAIPNDTSGVEITIEPWLSDPAVRLPDTGVDPAAVILIAACFLFAGIAGRLLGKTR